MASGYEKAECGVDPNEGWGRPSRVENIALSLVGGVFWLFATGSAVWSVLRLF